MVPSGEAVTGIDLSFEGNSLPNHVAYSIETDSDFLNSNSFNDTLIIDNQLSIEPIPDGSVATFTLLSSAPDMPLSVRSDCQQSTITQTQGEEFTYNHQIGSIFMEYSSAIYGSETCIDYKEPGASNFVLWKDYYDITNNAFYTKNQTKPLYSVITGLISLEFGMAWRW